MCSNTTKPIPCKHYRTLVLLSVRCARGKLCPSIESVLDIFLFLVAQVIIFFCVFFMSYGGQVMVWICWIIFRGFDVTGLFQSESVGSFLCGVWVLESRDEAFSPRLADGGHAVMAREVSLLIAIKFAEKNFVVWGIF